MSSANLSIARPFPATSSRLVALVGLDGRTARRVAEDWSHVETEVEAFVSLETMHRALGLSSSQPSVICFGAGESREIIADYISERAEDRRWRPCQYLILATDHHPEVFQPLVKRDLVFYLGSGLPDPEAMISLLEAALVTGAASSYAETVDDLSSSTLRLLEQIERGRGPEESFDRLEAAARELLSSRRAACRWFDAATLTLWRPSGNGDPRDVEERDSAVSGIVGFVARTGRSVRASRVGEDPRYDAEADNGGRSTRERMLAVALPSGSGALTPTATEAVLTVFRGARQDPFDADDLRQLEALACEAGPILRRRRLTFERALARRETEVFRQQALDRRQQGLVTRSAPLRLTPAWLDRAYRGILMLALLAMLALPFAGSDEFAVGTAVVRLGERVEVRARQAGVLARLPVRAGDRVHAGQEIGRLESSEEAAELERLRHELELRLAERLRHPGRSTGDSAYVALRERQRVAAARLERLILRAPKDGEIGDLLARPGLSLTLGQPVFTVIDPDSVEARSIEVQLPGRFRPLLATGMEIRFEIDGYPDAEVALAVRDISRQIIDPRQAGAFSTPPVSAAAGVEGVVIVRADLPAASFESGGRRFLYHDGLTGTAEIRVRKKRFLTDWLRRLG